MAHYLAEGRLHFADSRDEAVEQAVRSWATLTETQPIEQVALISDASNKEIHRLNARAAPGTGTSSSPSSPRSCAR